MRRAQRRRRRAGDGAPRAPSGGGAAPSTRARQRHDVAVGVAEDLDLDVARRERRALEEHAVVAERRLRLAPAPRRAPRRGRALASTTPHAACRRRRRRLHQHREADPLAAARAARASPWSLVGSPAPPARRPPPRAARAACLPPSRSIASARRADERRAPRRARARANAGVLAEEAVARVDRVGAGPARARRGSRRCRGSDSRRRRRRRCAPRRRPRSTCGARASASLWTATDSMPSRAARARCGRRSRRGWRPARGGTRRDRPSHRTVAASGDAKNQVVTHPDAERADPVVSSVSPARSSQPLSSAIGSHGKQWLVALSTNAPSALRTRTATCSPSKRQTSPTPSAARIPSRSRTLRDASDSNTRSGAGSSRQSVHPSHGPSARSGSSSTRLARARAADRAAGTSSNRRS